jgi:hypothetical protein
MGDFANRRITVIAASFGAFVVLTLNFVLLAGAFGVPVPFLG